MSLECSNVRLQLLLTSTESVRNLAQFRKKLRNVKFVGAIGHEHPEVQFTSRCMQSFRALYSLSTGGMSPSAALDLDPGEIIGKITRVLGAHSYYEVRVRMKGLLQSSVEFDNLDLFETGLFRIRENANSANCVVCSEEVFQTMQRAVAFAPVGYEHGPRRFVDVPRKLLFDICSLLSTCSVLDMVLEIFPGFDRSDEIRDWQLPDFSSAPKREIWGSQCFGYSILSSTAQELCYSSNCALATIPFTSKISGSQNKIVLVALGSSQCKVGFRLPKLLDGDVCFALEMESCCQQHRTLMPDQFVSFPVGTVGNIWSHFSKLLEILQARAEGAAEEPLVRWLILR